MALDDVDDVFGDVGGVIADALEIFGDEDELESGEDDAGIAHHVGKELAEDLIAEMIDLVIAGENFLSEIDVAADDGVQGVADHFLCEFAHARKIDVGLDARMAKDTRGALRDVDGLVADTLEIVVDAGNGKDKTEIHGHQLMESEELENAIGELLVGLEHGMDRLVHGAFGEAAHPKQPLF